MEDPAGSPLNEITSTVNREIVPTKQAAVVLLSRQFPFLVILLTITNRCLLLQVYAEDDDR